MVEYEMKENLINQKARDSTTGTRNLLRLHRALEYITAFLDVLPKLENPEKCCPPSQVGWEKEKKFPFELASIFFFFLQAAYKRTLAKYHPWIVQKAALMAMNMLPTKEGLINKLCDNNEEEYIKATEILPKAVEAMNKVYEITQQLYKEHKLLELP